MFAPGSLIAAGAVVLAADGGPSGSLALTAVSGLVTIVVAIIGAYGIRSERARRNGNGDRPNEPQWAKDLRKDLNQEKQGRDAADIENKRLRDLLFENGVHPDTGLPITRRRPRGTNA